MFFVVAAVVVAAAGFAAVVAAIVAVVVTNIDQIIFACFAGTKRGVLGCLASLVLSLCSS